MNDPILRVFFETERQVTYEDIQLSREITGLPGEGNLRRNRGNWFVVSDINPVTRVPSVRVSEYPELHFVGISKVAEVVKEVELAEAGVGAEALEAGQVRDGVEAGNFLIFLKIQELQRH